MDPFTVFPDTPISDTGDISRQLMNLDIHSFQEACRYVHELPYGYNSDRDDLMILFKEGMGSCTTKHAVIATLAQELELGIRKQIGIYAMTEAIVTGADAILKKYALPYLPMVHCFLTDGAHRVDLTEGNHNGKNRPVDTFLYVETVTPNISAKVEYIKYRNALRDRIVTRDELRGVDIKQILHAREEGIALLRSHVKK
ncbi:MAG: hypothetical protein ACLFQY_18045 [Desulfococcaceae bacterium]